MANIGSIFDKQKFLSAFKEELGEKYCVSANEAKPHQIHEAVSSVLMKQLNKNWEKSKKNHYENRRAMYLSMEFLMGRAVYNNLLCLGLTEEVEALLREAGADLSDLEEIEDAALGNGGLGRLAACFLDSAATLNLPLDGYGIRYKYGLFKQGLCDGWQTEMPDDWTKYGDPWSVRKENEAVDIYYGGELNRFIVRAIPYDMPIIGFGTDNIGTLRLWQAEAVNEFDFAVFDRGDYINASSEKTLAEDISRCLYPNDNSNEGKKLRLKQEYFFSAASIKDAVNKHKEQGRDIRDFAKFTSIQLNDTHPVIAIPEFIRILIDEENIGFFDALDIAKKTFNYTNHTIMAEALEKWNTDTVRELLPRVYEICVQVNEAFIGELYALGKPRSEIDSMKLIDGNTLHMARMAIYCGSAVNGVAAIHTEILKNDALNDWYKLYTNKFQNKTNGITPRRWLRLCNPELSEQITELIGSEAWVTDLDRLSELKKYACDAKQLEKFIAIKNEKKIQLSKYIWDNERIDVNPSSVFDIQIKRLHEYKRQLLNAFGILYMYYGIKDGSIDKDDFYPMTFIFGAKSAPGYARAKGIIKFINEIGKLVESDSVTRDLLKVVYVKNYRVTYAEKLVSAADVSEQISTAGTEASGTGNMKLMLNGAVTLGTLDGANVEIVEEAGAENNYIFGAKVDELKEIMKNYDPRKIIETNPKIARVVRSLIDGTVSDGGSGIFRELYFSLLDGATWHVPDNYYLLGDLQSYIDAKLKLNADYARDKNAFYKKCWLNMASAGKFSSDRTIRDYAVNIWNIH